MNTDKRGSLKRYADINNPPEVSAQVIKRCGPIPHKIRVHQCLSVVLFWNCCDKKSLASVACRFKYRRSLKLMGLRVYLYCHNQMSGNPVEIGDGFATVTGYRLPKPLACQAGKAGARFQPEVRIPVWLCSSRSLRGSTSPSKRRMRPACPRVRNRIP
jgi:hypothetical protein